MEVIFGSLCSKDSDIAENKFPRLAFSTRSRPYVESYSKQNDANYRSETK